MHSVIYPLVNSPVPNDLELAIPGSIPFFNVLIVIALIAHLIFVNIVVAGAVYTVWNEVKAIRKKDPVIDRLAYQIATQVTIHKSIAVVLGVAPLLVISTIYTQYFYPSTILIGKMWLALIPLLIIAFLLLYVYKFTWEKWSHRKAVHLSFGIAGTGILLFLPLVFISNATSMLNPQMWEGSRGFFHSLFYYPTIWQKYFHFMSASFTVMGMYMYWWGRKKSLKHSDPVYTEMKNFGKKSAFLFALLQLLAGPILLLSLDSQVRSSFLGGSLFHSALLVTAAILAVIWIAMLLQLIRHESKRLFVSSLALLLVIMGLMGWIRGEVRGLYLAPYMDESPRTVHTVK
ncbi:cytochrome c class I [Ferviditalea candida]|uniref:Cytochrome c class I n=1 Tax=Ferviditalea candida TaxID=3108399 RepID=A0ABU5ZHW5_9BACL|nr:cytochrome c class I [Paenibacillaceae bacterium T2]